MLFNWCELYINLIYTGVRIFSWWAMRLKFFCGFLSRFLQGLGMVMFMTGLLFLVWFSFFSNAEKRILLAGLSILELSLGYLIYWFAIKRLHDDFENYR